MWLDVEGRESWAGSAGWRRVVGGTQLRDGGGGSVAEQVGAMNHVGPASSTWSAPIPCNGARSSCVVLGERRQYERPRRQPVFAPAVGRHQALVRAAADAVGQPLVQFVSVWWGPPTVDREPCVGVGDRLARAPHHVRQPRTCPRIARRDRYGRPIVADNGSNDERRASGTPRGPSAHGSIRPGRR